MQATEQRKQAILFAILSILCADFAFAWGGVWFFVGGFCAFLAFLFAVMSWKP